MLPSVYLIDLHELERELPMAYSGFVLFLTQVIDPPTTTQLSPNKLPSNSIYTAEISTLIHQYDVFAAEASLPPQCSFDHHIILLEGSNPP